MLFSSQINGIAFMKSPKEVGIDFENNVHYTLANYLKIDNLLREKDIIKLYGISCTAIDHMFNIPNTNISICIQSNKSEENANNFIKCIDLVQKISSRYIQGILLSVQPITSNGNHAFGLINTSNSYIKLINIHLDIPTSQESQDILIDKLLHFLHNTYKLWTYDTDGSIVMRY